VTRRPTIVPRKPIFLGCEGKSEYGYGALLGQLVRDMPGLHVHVHVELLQPGAGNPEELVRRAIQKIDDRKRQREPFVRKAILLDLGDAEVNAAATRRAALAGIGHLIWQDPDHEAFLLRHLDGCAQLRPPRGSSEEALARRWPGYDKGQTRAQLARRIAMAQVRQACEVEPDLRAFLAAIGAL
jgi:hypothetical protein